MSKTCVHNTFNAFHSGLQLAAFRLNQCDQILLHRVDSSICIVKPVANVADSRVAEQNSERHNHRCTKQSYRLIKNHRLKHTIIPVRRLCIILGSILLAVTASLAQNVSAGSLETLKPGRRITVTLRNGDKAVGKLGAVTPTGFTLEPERRNQLPHDFEYTEVRTVRKKMARSTKWFIAGGVYGVFMTIGMIVGG